MSIKETTLNWIPRLILAGVMIPHGITKITEHSAFENKFNLSLTVGLAAAAAELAGALGILLGGVLLFSSQKLLCRVGTVFSLLGITTIAIVQVGAIITVHAPRWFYYINPSGMEYNIVLLSLCLMIAVGSLPLQNTVRRV